MPAYQFRRFCFTIQSTDGAAFEHEPSFFNPIEYLVYQTESAPTTGRLHIQGYLECNRKVTVAGLKVCVPWLGYGAHIEAAKGTWQSNKNYCQKDDSRAEGPNGEYGSPIIKGARTDLKRVILF